MTARFRFVHFIPDPFLGGRQPLAVLVQHGDQTTVVRVPRFPGAECLGGAAEAALARSVLEAIERTPDFDALALSVGPHAILDEHHAVPPGAEPTAWVRLVLDGHKSKTLSEGVRYRGPHRSTQGYKFFETHGVARYVQKTFDPARDLDGAWRAAAAIGPISQYVAGRSDVLLLEPILPARATWERDLQNVARTFGGYKTALRTAHASAAQFIVYVLGGPSRTVRSQIESALTPFADDVVDTSQPHPKANLLARIAATGKTAEEPGLLN